MVVRMLIKNLETGFLKASLNRKKSLFHRKFHVTCLPSCQAYEVCPLGPVITTFIEQF